jgi:hypothetical protein
MVPPDWTQLATKQDLGVLGAELRGEMNGLRGEMNGLRGEMLAQRGELLTTLHKELRKQTLFYIGALMALAGVLVSAQALG